MASDSRALTPDSWSTYFEFRAARLMVLNKADLLPYVPFDVETCIAYARRVNPQIGVLTVSALTGEGMARWYGWIEAQRAERAALAATG